MQKYVFGRISSYFEFSSKLYDLNHSESIDMHIEKFKFQVLLKQGRSSINITINQTINLSIYKPINPVRVSQGGYEDLSI